MFMSFVLGYLHKWTKIIPIGLPCAIVNAEMKQDVVNRMFNGSRCRRGQEIIAVVPILGIILEAKRRTRTMPGRIQKGHWVIALLML